VSAGGIRLVLRRRFEPGATLAIELPGPDPDQPSAVLARVVRVQPGPAGSWLLGCAFLSELSDEEVQALASPPRQQPEAPGRPASVAQESRPPSGKAFLTDLGFEGRLADGHVLRCRIRRLEVPAASPPRRGRTLRMRLTPGGPVLKLRVDSYRLEQARWVLRGTFLDANPAVLRSFVPFLRGAAAKGTVR
jgi:hypothetical protein